MKVLKIFKRFPCLFGWITIGRLPISSQAPCSSHFLTLWPHHAFLSIPFASNTLTASQLTINPSAVIVIRIYFFEFPEGEARQELPPEPHQLQLLPGLRTAVRYKQKRGRRRRRRRAYPPPRSPGRLHTYIHTTATTTHLPTYYDFRTYSATTHKSKLWREKPVVGEWCHKRKREKSCRPRPDLYYLSVSATTPHLYTTPQPSSLGKEQESKGVFIIPCYFLFFCSCFCPCPPATKGSEQRRGQLGSPNLAWLMESKTRKEFYYY